MARILFVVDGRRADPERNSAGVREALRARGHDVVCVPVVLERPEWIWPTEAAWLQRAWVSSRLYSPEAFVLARKQFHHV